MSTLNVHLNLNDLPLPYTEKTGWPWTEQSEFALTDLDKFNFNDCGFPRISIITPSYNQGEFIEESIRSVLLQGYPNLEYIIIDGGSTDNTIDIIKKYEAFISYWISEPDTGQANAINKGLRYATGELIGWQNSDDYYHPNAFYQVASASRILNDIEVFYGDVYITSIDGKLIDRITAPKFELIEMFPWFKLHNESMFFRKKILESGHSINENFRHYMDYEFFWQMILSGYKFSYVPGLNAYHRRHPNAKSSTQHDIAAQELLKTYKIAYNHSSISNVVKEVIIECSLGLCLDNFAKLRLNLFRQSFRDLIKMSGFRMINKKLILKYLISYFGVDFIKKTRKFMGKDPELLNLSNPW